MTPASKVAITVPPDVLAAADALAARLGRSRSWVFSEAMRRFVAHEHLTHELDASRAAQLRYDLTLAASQRVQEAEQDLEVLGLDRRLSREEPRHFATYDEFVAWRAAARNGG